MNVQEITVLWCVNAGAAVAARQIYMPWEKGPTEARKGWYLKGPCSSRKKADFKGKNGGCSLELVKKN